MSGGDPTKVFLVICHLVRFQPKRHCWHCQEPCPVTREVVNSQSPSFAARGFVRNCRLVSTARQCVSSFLKGEHSREKEEQRLPPQECLLLGMCEIAVFLNKLSGCILREITCLDGFLRWCKW